MSLSHAQDRKLLGGFTYSFLNLEDDQEQLNAQVVNTFSGMGFQASYGVEYELGDELAFTFELGLASVNYRMEIEEINGFFYRERWRGSDFSGKYRSLNGFLSAGLISNTMSKFHPQVGVILDMELDSRISGEVSNDGESVEIDPKDEYIEIAKDNVINGGAGLYAGAVYDISEWVFVDLKVRRTINPFIQESETTIISSKSKQHQVMLGVGVFF